VEERVNVLLVTSPPVGPIPFFVGEKRPPLGLWSLAASLRQAGHYVGFQDLYTKDEPLAPVSRFDAVGIYANTVCFRGTLRVLDELLARRKAGWRGKVLVGGPHASVLPETVPEWVDCVVQGEGEVAALAALEGRCARVYRAARIRDLDLLPRPAYDLVSRYQYNLAFQGVLGGIAPVFTMNTSRGCPRACTFCSVGSIWGRTYTRQSAGRVLDDVAWLAKDFGARGIYFREDEFTMDKARLHAFCQGMLARRLSLPWMCESRVDALTDPAVVDMMAGAGCRGLYVGVESGSDRMLSEVFDKGITAAQVRLAFANARRAGIKTCASFVKGTGYETAEDERATAALAAEIRPDVVWHNQFTGIPYSPLYRRLLRDGRVARVDDLGLAYPKVCP
jgi:radical SAM superfamily enzyme YgiQ (UPF0313 family)